MDLTTYNILDIIMLIYICNMKQVIKVKDDASNIINSAITFLG